MKPCLVWGHPAAAWQWSGRRKPECGREACALRRAVYDQEGQRRFGCGIVPARERAEVAQSFVGVRTAEGPF